MLVKDEAPVLRRCLDSISGIVDYWVICHAGSAVGTKEMLKQCLSGVPGEFHEIAWTDAGQTRTAALKLARGKGDYHLFLDADMTVSVTGEFRDLLEADSCLVREESEAQCWAERLVSDQHEWRYVGAARPFLYSTTSRTREKLNKLTITRHEDNAAHAVECRRDIELLTQSLERGANVPRATFHLAQCYRDLGNLPLAIEYYEKRATLGGWAEEVWYSLYQVARLQQRLGIAWMLVLDQYLRAYEFRPSRIEPLYHIARFYRENGQPSLARLFAGPGLGAPYPDDLLFIERQVYEGGMEPLSCTEPIICADIR